LKPLIAVSTLPNAKYAIYVVDKGSTRNTAEFYENNVNRDCSEAYRLANGDNASST